MKKKLMALMLTLVLIISLLPAVHAAEVIASGHGWNVDWVLTDDGTLTISGNGYMDARTEVNTPWNRYMDQVRSVVINEGVLSIAANAFSQFENLTSITIPEGLTSIGRSALIGCVNLTAIHIPSSVETIGTAALAGCGLTAFIVAEDNPNFTTIDGVLVNKEKTELIQVPGGRTGSYEIPEYIQSFYRYTFDGCNKLTEVIFPDHFTEFPEAVLYGLESLVNVKLPAALTEIPRAAFYNCAKLASIEIPDGVTAIGMDAFFGCASLETVVIPATVEHLDTQVFGECDSLANVVFRGHAPTIGSESGIFAYDTLTAWYPAGDESWTEEIMQDYYGDVTWKAWEVLSVGDVLPFQFFYDGVAWALEEGITTGTSATEFSPNEACLRSQVVTFLWRAAGEPKAKTAVNPFVDVKSTDYFYEAVLWAVEQGITTGMDDTHFEPYGICNRSQVVTFLYRAFGQPTVGNVANPFTDVPSNKWYAAPVLWAVKEGITNGMSENSFAPENTCTRAQVVTFLYRAYVN